MIKQKLLFFLLSHCTLQACISREQANELLNNGNRFAHNHDFESAATIYQKIVDQFPSSAVAQYNLGYALNELTDYHGAADAFERACSIAPTAQNYLGLATALLALGDYEKGWATFEHRWQLPDKQNIRFPFPRWDGKAILNNKKILLLSEGGLGDCIQFIRYTQQIKNQGAYVIVLVPNALSKLCSLCPFIDQIITSGNPIPDADYYTSLMSLPALLGTTLQTVPAQIPYLKVDPLLFDYWKKVLINDSPFKVGICWQADPANDANRPPQARRSLDPAVLAPLAQIPLITLYSLHNNLTPPPWIHHFGSSFDQEHGRFMDTAALICNLDLVITVDTAIAHLAGALGVPTWLILPYKADWRWLTNTDLSPFYPTMYIFRASKNESWHDLIKTIADTVSLSLTSHQGT